MKIVKPSVKLLHHTPDAERVIEAAGRVCWKSEDRITGDSHAAFIRMLKSKEHESVLEHASAGFLIVTDRAIANEIVRHRVGMSYSQESTRYCCYSKDKFSNEITVVCPSGMSDDAAIGWEIACRKAESYYFSLLDSGCQPQMARAALPLCLKTELVATGTLRAWRHFLKLRMANAAHPDIRIIARLLLEHLLEIAPTVFEDIK